MLVRASRLLKLGDQHTTVRCGVIAQLKSLVQISPSLRASNPPSVGLGLSFKGTVTKALIVGGGAAEGTAPMTDTTRPRDPGGTLWEAGAPAEAAGEGDEAAVGTLERGWQLIAKHTTMAKRRVAPVMAGMVHAARRVGGRSSWVPGA